MRNALTIFLIMLSVAVFAQQGHLLFIGGGTERSTDNAWNKDPYTWAIDNSLNKKVAIISYAQDDDGWLPNYFVNNCGAVSATHFTVSNKTEAESEALYDNIVACDVVFFKGGDQSRYYEYYRDTRLQDAVEEIFKRGGVICGTSAGAAILSDVVFTAEEGTVYPQEALENPNNRYMTLKNDFFSFTNNLVVDTHFSERGRMGRLVGFMGNWFLNQGNHITGIGVDDQTAFAIDTDGKGKAFGTGAVHVYTSDSKSNFRLLDNSLVVDSIQFIQLLNGDSINMNNLVPSIKGFNSEVDSKPAHANYSVFMSGANALSYNQEMLDDLINHNTENKDMLVLSSKTTSLQQDIADYLENSGMENVTKTLINESRLNDTVLCTLIDQSDYFIFCSLEDDFVNLEGVNMVNLLNASKKDGCTSVFIGDASRLAGSIAIENYLEESAAYYGELSFNEGLKLLPGIMVQPNTYLNADLYENTMCAISYGLLNEKVHKGLWLTKENWLKISPESNQVIMRSKGAEPLQMLLNNSILGNNSSTSSRGTSSEIPRMIVSYDAMEYAIIGERDIVLGDEVNKRVNIDRLITTQGASDIRFEVYLEEFDTPIIASTIYYGTDWDNMSKTALVYDNAHYSAIIPKQGDKDIFYKVTFLDENNELVEKAGQILFNIDVGIHRHQPHIKVWYNHETASLNIDGTEGFCQVQLINMSGQPVFDSRGSNKQEIALPHGLSGIFCVRLSNKSNLYYSEKLFINN